jgi:hypothetical protein
MKHLVALLCLCATHALADDFSAGSDAQSWGLPGERPARFTAKVVDVLCTLTGDCPDACGGGARQLGLLRSADDALILPNKNAEPFTGAVVDLLPHCGGMVEVDGLMIEDPAIGAHNIYAVQKLRPAGAADWTNATRWVANWAKANPQAPDDGAWFRNDPRINAMIGATGYLGLGLETDATYLKELFP